MAYRSQEVIAILDRRRAITRGGLEWAAKTPARAGVHKRYGKIMAAPNV